MAKSLNTDKVLEELDKVPLSRLISAIESIKKHYPDKNDDYPIRKRKRTTSGGVNNGTDFKGN